MQVRHLGPNVPGTWATVLCGVCCGVWFSCIWPHVAVWCSVVLCHAAPGVLTCCAMPRLAC
jgi:hypothetical protein